MSLFNRFFEEQGAKVTPRECFAIIMIALKAQESNVFGDREIGEVAILTGLDTKIVVMLKLFTGWGGKTRRCRTLARRRFCRGVLG